MPTDTTSDFGWKPAESMALAEIDRAATALRSVQPDLESWSSAHVADGAEEQPASVWPAIITGWVVAIVLLAATIGAIGLLLIR